MSSQARTCPRCSKSTPSLMLHAKLDCEARFIPDSAQKFGFKYNQKSYVGPGYFWVDQWLDTQDERDVCWNAALVNCVNASLGSRTITKRMVAEICKTDLFSHKGLQPHEFFEAASMVLTSNHCPAKITLKARRWKKDTQVAKELVETLRKGNGAMISVNHNQHVQVVLGYAKQAFEILLYDTASNGLQSVSLPFIAEHETTEWVYLFD